MKEDPKWEAPSRPKGRERNRDIKVAEDVFWVLNIKTKAMDDACADQFIDDILRQWCRENLPELVKLREQRDSLYDQQKEIDKLAIKTAAKPPQ